MINYYLFSKSMEGELFFYKGLVGGFKKIYALIDSSDFVAYETKRNSDELVEILRVCLEIK